MTTPNAAPEVIAVAGASSFIGSQILLHLESTAPGCRLVALDESPLRWPISGASAHRLGLSYVGENITLDDVPDLLRLESADTLIHVGSHYDGPSPERFLGETAKWVVAGRAAGLRQFIYLSDFRVYGLNTEQPTAITERAAASTNGANQHLCSAEPRARLPQHVTPPADAMRVAVLRAAMTVGPNGGSPSAAEFFTAPPKSNDKRNPPLQFLHDHDLARATVAAIRSRLFGIYNLAGDGTIPLNDVTQSCRKTGAPSARRRSRKTGGKHTGLPPVLSTTKFKQAARFRYKYSSAQTFRAYCHSVLLEPASR